MLNYGANHLQINGHEILITKGVFASENAWGGDGYTVLVHEPRGWQYARLDEELKNNVIIWSVPHTEEGSITAIHFMTPKIANPARNISNLYLLKTHRDFNESPLDVVPAQFTLYMLQLDTDFNIYYLNKIAAAQSAGKYCNADSAAYHELGIPLPGDGEEYPCVK